MPLPHGVGWAKALLSGAVLDIAANRADDRPAAHYGAMGKRVRSPAVRQPLEAPTWSDSGQRGVGQELGVPLDERETLQTLSQPLSDGW